MNFDIITNRAREHIRARCGRFLTRFTLSSGHLVGE
jgi:hypothetical protein